MSRPTMISARHQRHPSTQASYGQPRPTLQNQATEDKAATKVNAKSYKNNTSIGLAKMYSQPAVLDTGCGPI